MRPLVFAVQLVQRVQVGLGRGHDNVGVGALTVDRAAVLRQPHGDFALRVEKTIGESCVLQSKRPRIGAH